MAGPFSGTVAIRAMKDGDYQATIFAGTNTGLQAAVDYVDASGGKVSIGPGTVSIATGITVNGDKVQIEGAGIGSTILDYTGGNTALTFATTGGVSKGHQLSDLTIKVGADQTGNVVQFTGGDMRWAIRDVLILNPNPGFTLGTGIEFLNCQNGSVWNLTVRSDDSSKLWAKGINIDINDAVNRGNIMFFGGLVSNSTIGASIAVSGPGNAINNCAFYGTKFVNFSGINPDNTTAVDINGQADETGFYSCHFERFQNGIDNDLADSMAVIGCIFSNIKNQANSAGDAIRVTSAEAATILSNRIASCYNGVILDGTTKTALVTEGRWTVTNSTFSDTSTGAQGNFYIAGASITPSGDPVRKSLASGASITLPRGNYVLITGTAAITSINASALDKGRIVVLEFSGTAATTGLTDGSNLKLAGNFVYTPDDTVTLICDGTNWVELSRSVN